MTLSPAHQKFLVFGLIGISIVGILYAGVGLMTTSQTAIAPEPVESTSEVIPLEDTPIETASLYLSSSPDSEVLFLDSRGQKISAITLRFNLARSSVTAPMSFKLDPELVAAGWQVAINDSTEGNTVFELALLNAMPNGGMIFTSEMPIGTFQNSKELSLALDSSVSMAIPPQGAQLELEFIRQE